MLRGSARAWVLTVVAAVLVLWSSRPGSAAAQRSTERCGRLGRPWVSLEFTWNRQRVADERAILADLRAGFSGSDIDVCALTTGPEHAPVASVQISRDTVHPNHVSVEIKDTITDKRVGRQVDLSNVPEDGRPFAIALATDELVWASWAELALERDRPKPEAPPEIARGIERELPEPALEPGPRIRLAGRASGERYSGGQDHLGAELGLAFPLTRRLHLDLALGWREGFVVTAPNGRIDADAIGFAFGLRPLLVTRTNLELGLELGGHLSWVRLRGDASEAATASELSRSIAYARLGPSVEWRVSGPVWLGGGVFLGLPLRAIEATDAGEVATGASGLAVALRVGLTLEL